MTLDPGHLCQQCSNVDFDFFFDAHRRNRQKEASRYILWKTLRGEECNFCQLLVHCLNQEQDANYQWQGSLRGVYTGNELQLYTQDDGCSEKLSYSIRRCTSKFLPSQHDGPQSPAKFNVGELRFWLTQCDLHQCLPQNSSRNPPSEDFRLVDVDNNCVVRPKTHVDYCALSYVWGDVFQTWLTSESGLDTSNCLAKLDLPKTIIEAMTFCREIGCHYLWVDSLCIVQNSKAEKHRQILSMADIYSQSFLTIIAATGEDANGGLAPFHAAERHPKVSYLVRQIFESNYVAALRPESAAGAIARSKWARRGWCQQEYALSRRVFFLTGAYAFLRCEKGFWCEDFGLGFSNCFEEDQKWDLPVTPFYRRRTDSNRHYSTTYSQMLGQFIRRELLYEDDIIAAFTGILTRMSDSIGTHMWGLPSKEIGVALQWTTKLLFPSSLRSGFPSWSWAGWIHSVDAPSSSEAIHDIYDGYDDISADMSVLTCHTVAPDLRIQCIKTYNLSAIIEAIKRAEQEPKCFTNMKETAGVEPRLPKALRFPTKSRD